MYAALGANLPLTLYWHVSCEIPDIMSITGPSENPVKVQASFHSEWTAPESAGTVGSCAGIRLAAMFHRR